MSVDQATASAQARRLRRRATESKRAVTNARHASKEAQKALERLERHCKRHGITLVLEGPSGQEITKEQALELAHIDAEERALEGGDPSNTHSPRRHSDDTSSSS
jgi:sugar phosphate isomerase/epimerase